MERMNGIQACEIIVSMEKEWLKSQEKQLDLFSAMRANKSNPP